MISNSDMIDQETGAVLWDVVKRRASARAAREFGAANPPPRYVRDALRDMRERAFFAQKQVCKKLGISADGRGAGPQVSVTLAGWGASGDSFAREG